MEHNTDMSTPNELLAQHPSIGFVAVFIGFITPFISSVLPIIQLFVALAGLVIGVLTIEAKWNERRRNRKGKK